MKKFKKSNLIFLCILAVILIVGLFDIIYAPVDINEYENRTAEKLEKLTFENYLNSKFQDSVELAAGDQIPFAIEMKKAYNQNLSKFTSNLLISIMAKEDAKNKDDEKDKQDTNSSGSAITSEPAINTGSAITSDAGISSGSAISTEPAISTGGAAGQDKTDDKQDSGKKTGRAKNETDNDGYTPNMSAIGNTSVKRTGNLPPNFQKYINNGYRTYRTQLLYGTYGTNEYEALRVHADNRNAIAEAHPEIKFAAFFLERETNVDFGSGYRNNDGKVLYDALNFEYKTVMRIIDFESYSEEFYHTDHHWNYKGSYRGYVECLAMLLPEEDPLEPTGEYFIGYCAGSMTNTDATASYFEPMFMYDFDFPDYVIKANGAVQRDYGGKPTQKDIVQYAIDGKYYEQVTYANIYGGDAKELIIDNQSDTGNGNILVMGSSYDNAVLKLLAAHYDCLYSVDLRKWPAAEGSERGNGFKLSSYLEGKDITTILYFGDDWYWTAKSFYVYD